MASTRQTTWRWAALLAVVLASVRAAPASPQGVGYYFESRSDRDVDGKSTHSTMKGWLKTPTVYRIEMTNGAKTDVVINSGSDRWTYNAKTLIGVHRKLPPALVADLKRRLRALGDDLPGFQRAGGIKDGQEKVGNVLCDVYRFVNKNRLKFALWVEPGPERLTRRKEISGASRLSTAPGETMKVHTLHEVVNYDWKLRVPMKDTDFRLPAGARIREYQPASPPMYEPKLGGTKKP